MNALQMECSRCRVAVTCPRKGASPLVLQSGKKVFCQIVGGYGRAPVDRDALSKESLEAADRDGPCLTLAEVPTFDPDADVVVMEVTKIFSHPVLHERETIGFNQELIYPKSHT
jgi:hypothetical protein